MFSTTPPGAQSRARPDTAPPPSASATPIASAEPGTTTAPDPHTAPVVVRDPIPAPPLAHAARLDAQVQQVVDLLLAPGHHALTGGCLSEPAVAARATAAAGLRRSLAVVSTHAAAVGLARMLRAQGLAAEAYPKLHRETCRVWDDGPGDAAAAGLPVAALFCPTCPHRQGADVCPFARDRQAAEAAPHLVLTSHRAALDPAARVANRDAVLFVQSHPSETLHPARDVRVGDDGYTSGHPAWASESLRLLDAAAETIITLVETLGEAVVGPGDYWPWVRRLARAADDALRSDGATALALPAASDPAAAKPPGERHTELWGVLRDAAARPAAAVTRSLLAAAAGDLEQLVVYPAAALAAGSTSAAPPPAGGHLVEVHCLRRLPSDIPVVALGDHDASLLSAATEVRWDATAGTTAVADVWARVTRILRRVTSASRPSRHLDRVRLMLRLYPGRVGVLAHPNLLQSLKRRTRTEGWPEAERGRITTAKWFAQDPDHLAGCDVILGLGAPRPHRLAVFKRLLQAGDPAAFEEPGWGELSWQGTGADGRPALVAGHGYGHPAWQAADREIAVGVLRAWLGGTACPVVLVADDRLDVPLGGSEDHGGMTVGCGRVLAALTAELMARTPPAVPDAVPDTAPARAPDRPRAAGMKTGELAARLDEPERTVRHWMALLDARNLVGRENKFAGWTATPCVAGAAGDLPAGCRRVLAALRAEGIADSPPARTKTPISSGHGTTQGKTRGIEEKRAAGRESATTGPHIADLLGLPKPAVRKHLNRLVVLGLVRRARGKGPRGAALWTLTRLACPDAVLDPAAVPAHEEVRANAATGRPGLSFVAVAYATSLRAADRPLASPHF